jgi:hypothetical protein
VKQSALARPHGITHFGGCTADVTRLRSILWVASRPLLRASQEVDVPSKNTEVEKRPNGSPADLSGRRIDTLESRYGNRFLLEPAPDNRLPKSGMPAADAMRLVGEEVLLDGLPMRNLATFVTTWMEPEAD